MPTIRRCGQASIRVPCCRSSRSAAQVQLMAYSRTIRDLFFSEAGGMPSLSATFGRLPNAGFYIDEKGFVELATAWSHPRRGVDRVAE